MSRLPRSLVLPDGLDPVVRRALGLPAAGGRPAGPLRLEFAPDGSVRPVVMARPRLAGSFRLPLARGGSLSLHPGRPVVMGILNVTPDSFHDGDPGAGAAAHLARALAMLEAGATVLDVGGESTRPGAAPVPVKEEIRRTAPLIRRLRARGVEAAVSIDTSKAAVARAALEAGADMVNDVTGGAGDPGMLELVAQAGCAYVLMHMRGDPATMRSLAEYPGWPPATIARELAASARRAQRAGVRAAQLVLDPGIGFAKDWRQSLECLRRLDAFRGLGRPVLVGASRKSLLLGAAGVTASRDRLPGSLVLAVHAASRGASLLRVHDVAETVQALRTAQALEKGLEA